MKRTEKCHMVPRLSAKKPKKPRCQYTFKVVKDVYDDKTLRELKRVYPTKKPHATGDNSVISRGSRVDVLLEPGFAVKPQRDLHKYKLPLKPWVRGLMTFGKSGAQAWHMDDVEGPRVKYLTLLVALEDMTPEMPHTEFNLGDGVIVRPTLTKNQGVLFDGRLMHRGGAGNVPRVPVVYQVYTKNVDENVEDEVVYKPRRTRKFTPA